MAQPKEGVLVGQQDTPLAFRWRLDEPQQAGIHRTVSGDNRRIHIGEAHRRFSDVPIAPGVAYESPEDLAKGGTLVMRFAASD